MINRKWMALALLAAILGGALAYGGLGMTAGSRVFAAKPTEVPGQGNNGGTHGNSDAAPGQTGEAGNSDENPGHSSEAPGQTGDTPGQSGETPGQSGAEPPGQSGNNPGLSGSAPGLDGTPKAGFGDELDDDDFDEDGIQILDENGNPLVDLIVEPNDDYELEDGTIGGTPVPVDSQVVAFDIGIRNDTDGPVTLDPADFTLVGSDGNTYTPIAVEAVDGEIAAGEIVQGTLVFLLPVGVEPVSVQYAQGTTEVVLYTYPTDEGTPEATPTV